MHDRIQESTSERYRLQLKVAGAVQGVGFRPFVYRLARDLELTGFVMNNSQGVIIEIEGSKRALADFKERFRSEIPPRAIVNRIIEATITPLESSVFAIAESSLEGSKTTIILPDIATCDDCLREVFDPSDRRYLYPFTNCTNCGPRYSIITALPYDRGNTTMKKFTMCDLCAAEYHNPSDRRFHAQPNACPNCGPKLEFWDSDGKPLAGNDDAIDKAIEQIRHGKILAIKGLGGFQLMVDASSPEAVRELRVRKRRSNKPLAVMYPTIEMIKRDCALTDLEVDLLCSAESPIVICHRNGVAPRIAEEVAPGNPYLGVMLPYTPLHHILMRQLNQPVVATSGNLSEEPLCIDEHEALRRLKGIADCLLVHDRPIHRHVDDSVARKVAGSVQIIRRARGYAPLPIMLHQNLPESIAVGGHLKNTVAIGKGRQIFVSQHIGDLESLESNEAFKDSLRDLTVLYELNPSCVAHDAHPDYASTRHAAALSGIKVAVQHHYAHVLSCMADNNVEAPLLGVAWDGTGFGLDRTIWGGEFLAVNETSFDRVAHFRSFPLPGGDIVAKEPRRSAAGVLYEICDGSYSIWRKSLPDNSFSDSEAEVLWKMLRQGLNAPRTTSVGRLFDAVGALLGLSQECTFEGEAAMMLEFATANDSTSTSYQFGLDRNTAGYEIDWRPMIVAITADREAGVTISQIAVKFHNTLTEIIVTVAQRVQLRRVLLSGGCFQNKYLSERTISRLRSSGFLPYWHHQIPTNDGGIAVGQLVAAARSLEKVN